MIRDGEGLLKKSCVYGKAGDGFRNYMTGTMLGLPLPIFLYRLFFDYLAMPLNIQ